MAESWLDNVILKYIGEVYDMQAKYGGREPCISASALRDYLNQLGGVPDDFHYSIVRRQNSAIQTSLRRLVRQGKLTFSYGAGLRGGEVRCYEPGAAFSSTSWPVWPP